MQLKNRRRVFEHYSNICRSDNEVILASYAYSYSYSSTCFKKISRKLVKIYSTCGLNINYKKTKYRDVGTERGGWVVGVVPRLSGPKQWEFNR